MIDSGVKDCKGESDGEINDEERYDGEEADWYEDDDRDYSL